LPPAISENMRLTAVPEVERTVILSGRLAADQS
jgi:hypothetical protein